MIVTTADIALSPFSPKHIAHSICGFLWQWSHV